jgi:ATP-dependent Clp protease ATP-binding subunit ClpC
VFERFTERARRVLVYAQEEAKALDHNFIGTEHLLLGLLREGEGVAAQALGSLGITLEASRSQLRQIVSPGESPVTDLPPFTPRAKKVLELSMRESVALGHRYIGPEHILLGLMREGEGVAAQMLVESGVALSEVRQRVIDLSGETPVEEATAGAPDCPHCRSPLQSSARVHRLAVPEGDEGAAEHPFLVVYCSTCGRALAFKPLTP